MDCTKRRALCVRELNYLTIMLGKIPVPAAAFDTFTDLIWFMKYILLWLAGDIGGEFILAVVQALCQMIFKAKW